MPTQNDDAWPVSALSIFDRNRDRRVPLGSRIATEDRTTKSWATVSRFRERHRLLRRSRARSTVGSREYVDLVALAVYDRYDQPVFPRGEEGPLGPQS